MDPDKKLFTLHHKLIPLIMIIAGFTWTTQSFAQSVGYSGELGPPLLFWQATPIYNPLSIIFWGVKFYPITEVHSIFAASIYPLLILSIAAIITYFFLSMARGINKNKNLHGTAKWGTKKDLKKNGLCSKETNGIVLGQTYDAKLKIDASSGSLKYSLKKPGKLIVNRGDTSSLIIAGARSGKGISSVITTLLTWEGSIVNFDPKSENYHITAGYRETFSKIIRFSPASAGSSRYNPLQEIRPGKSAFKDASSIAEILIAPSGEEVKDGSVSSHFNDIAKDLLTGLILHVVSCPDVIEKTLATCLDIMSGVAPSEDSDEEEDIDYSTIILKTIMNSHHIDPVIHQKVKSSVGRALNKDGRERSSLISTVVRSLRLFDDPIIRENTSACDFSIYEFVTAEKPISLYLTTPYSEIDRITPIMRLFISYYIRRLSEGETKHDSKLKNKLLFLLDEFPLLGNFPTLEKTMGVLPGYGITFMLICQSLQQLNKIYGTNHSYFDHCKSIVTFTPGDYNSAQLFSNMLGKRSTWKSTVSSSGTKYSAGLRNMSASGSEIQTNLLNPDELMHMNPDEIIIFNQGMDPYKGKKNIYFDDKRFKKYANLPLIEDKDHSPIENYWAKACKDKALLHHYVEEYDSTMFEVKLEKEQPDKPSSIEENCPL